MRFDFTPFFNPGENIPWDRVVRMLREQSQLAEQAGFTTVWFTEHHFAHNGFMNAPPNPILMGADVAAHCKKIRVGQAPVVLPDWHPLRVAEDVALLDNMTEGRVDFGAGRGINERTTIQFNVDADRRDHARCEALFRECLDIVIKAWTEDPFSYRGEFYRFPVPGWQETNQAFAPLDSRYHAPDGEYVGMYVHPRPYQKPHPPVWIMSNTPVAYASAGAEGMKVIGMASAPGRIRSCWHAYREAASRARGCATELGEGVAICVMIYVAETMEAAARDVRHAANTFYKVSSGRMSGNEAAARRNFLDTGEELRSEDIDADWYDFLLARDVIWAGSPDYVAEKIERFQADMGLSHIMLLEPFPGLAYEKILNSMTLFAERVVPRFGPQSQASAD